MAQASEGRIDAALTPDGSIILMAYGDATAVSVKVIDDERVEISDGDGKVLASSYGVPDVTLHRLVTAKHVDVLLAGSKGVTGFGFSTDEARSARKDTCAILAKLGDGADIHIDEVQEGAWSAVSAVANVAMTIATSASDPCLLMIGAENRNNIDFSGLSPALQKVAMRAQSLQLIVALNRIMGSEVDPDRVLDQIDWAEHAKSAHLPAPSAAVERDKANTLALLLGESHSVFVKPGPLTDSKTAFQVGREVLLELAAGCIPVLSAVPGEIALGLDYPGVEQYLSLRIKTDGEYAGTAMRLADGKLRDFGVERPALRSETTERHIVSPDGSLAKRWESFGATMENVVSPVR